MRIAMIGAGAMGGSFGGQLARSGADILLIDTWRDHVEAINRDGLQLSGALGEHVVQVPAVTETAGAAMGRRGDRLYRHQRHRLSRPRPPPRC